MKVIYPEDLKHVDSFRELLSGDQPQIWPCIAPETISCRPWREIGTTTLSSHPDDQVRGPSYQGNGWSIVRATNVIVCGPFVLTTSGDVLIVRPWWQVGITVDYFGADKDVILSRLPEVVHQIQTIPREHLINIDQPCTFFHQASHGHWLFEGLLPLAVWKSIDYYPLLVSGKHAQYRTEFLDLLGYPADRRMMIDSQFYFCKELLVPVPWRTEPLAGVSHSEGWTPDGRHCYAKLHSWWHNASSLTFGMTRGIAEKTDRKDSNGSRIFVCRDSYENHRLCLNEKEAAQIAKKHGFQTVIPSKLTAAQEAATFYHADIICGTSGGALNNTIFSRPGTKIVCLGAENDILSPNTHLAAIGQMDLLNIRSTQFSGIDSDYIGTLSGNVVDLILLDEILSSLS